MSTYFPVVRQLPWAASVQASLFLALTLRELLGVCPELADGHGMGKGDTAQRPHRKDCAFACHRTLYGNVSDEGRAQVCGNR